MDFRAQICRTSALGLTLLAASLVGCGGAQSSANSPEAPLTVAWPLQNTSKVGGYRAQPVGRPVPTNDAGPVLCFGGKEDGLIVDINPLDAQYAFTVQVLIKPLSGGGGKQQFFHLQDEADNRVLLETRSAPSKSWYLHAFIKSGEQQKELALPTSTHAADEWYWVAVTYADGEARSYVNGQRETNAEFVFEPMKHGRMAIGTRLNSENFFKGCVGELRFANGALPSRELAQDTSLRAPPL